MAFSLASLVRSMSPDGVSSGTPARAFRLPGRARGFFGPGLVRLDLVDGAAAEAGGVAGSAAAVGEREVCVARATVAAAALLPPVRRGVAPESFL